MRLTTLLTVPLAFTAFTPVAGQTAEPPEISETPDNFEMYELNTKSEYPNEFTVSGNRCKLRPLSKRDTSGMETCFMFGQFMIGRVELSSFFVTFRDRKLAYISGKADRSEFRELAAAFEAKYGGPDTTEENEVQNRMGAKFQNLTLGWEFEGGTLILEAYGEKVTETQFQFITPAALRDDTPPEVNF